MAFLLQPFMQVVAKPALLPVGGAMFGMWYGAYDISLKVVGTAVGSQPRDKVVPSKRLTTFLTGAGASLAGVYVRATFDPPPVTTPLRQAGEQTTLNAATGVFRNAVHVIRSFPYFWYGTSTFAAGAFAGTVVAILRR